MPLPRPPYRRASLLGIPVELRLTVYDYVLYSAPGHSDDAEPSVWKFEYKDCAFGTVHDYGSYIKRCKPHFSQLAWLSLRSSCSTLRDELLQHMQSRSLAPHGLPNDAYEMHIAGANSRLTDLTWTSVLCPPSECHVLEAHVTLPWDVRFHGCGGPTPIAGNLYQTLNRFVHYGPVLDAKASLPCRVALDVLRVFVHTERPDGDLELAVDTQDIRDIRRSVTGFARMLEESGLLQGVVARIEVLAAADFEAAAVSESGEDSAMVLHSSIVVQPRDEGAEIPEHWKGYGFGWGVDPNGAD